MKDITTGDIIKCVFTIDKKNIFVSVEYTGEYSEFEGEKSYYFANTKSGVEYSFTSAQLVAFNEASERHALETITFE